jgi:hypothetical protein
MEIEKTSKSRPNPTPSAIINLLFFNRMAKPEEASASESASEINTWVKLNHHPGIARPSLAKAGFAARLV